MNTIIIREDGTRHAGCDESSGWVWYAARQLELALVTVVEDLESRLLSTSPCGTETGPTDMKRNATILELGSGTGWLSLQLALRGATVTATERSGAMSLLTRNIMSNQERIDNLNVCVEELEWSSDLRLEGQWDLFVGSDLIYIHENNLPLLRTLLRHDCQFCVLSWEERKPKEEANFILLAQQNNFHIDSLVQIGTNPATGNIVWLLCMSFQKPCVTIAEDERHGFNIATV
jgi:SAM-dependent methyltransferase